MDWFKVKSTGNLWQNYGDDIVLNLLDISGIRGTFLLFSWWFPWDFWIWWRPVSLKLERTRWFFPCFFDVLPHTLQEINIGVGRLVSLKKRLFSRSMLIYQRVLCINLKGNWTSINAWFFADTPSMSETSFWSRLLPFKDSITQPPLKLWGWDGWEYHTIGNWAQLTRYCCGCWNSISI